MSAMVGSAFMYLLFAFCFVVFISMLGIQKSSEIYAATILHLEHLPWHQAPRKTMHDVRGGQQVYEWITKVLVPEIYKEKPVSTDILGHCVKEDLCTYGQGSVRSDDQCQSGLVKGFNNCPSHMGTGSACCESCNGSSCQDIEVRTELATLVNTTSTDDLSQSCATAVPEWLQDLRQWTRPEAVRRLNAADAKELVFCPERLSAVGTDLASLYKGIGTPLTMAEYNQVLMGRITMKRVKVIDHSRKATTNAYPKQQAGSNVDAWSSSTSNENTEAFGEGKYKYQDGKGLAGTGGYVDYLDFALPEGAILDKFSEMEKDHWFDLNQGSFAVELLLFNGNVDRFLYVTFVFQHDFSGLTEARVVPAQLDMRLHDLSQPAAFLRFILYIVILVLFAFFVKMELEDLSGNLSGYFSGLMAPLHLVSMILVTVCLVLYLQIVVSYSYLHYNLPLKSHGPERIAEFEDLTNLCTKMSSFSNVVSVTACLIFVRCIFLMSSLTPQAVIFYNGLCKVKSQLIAWLVVCMICLVGFSITGHFLFGATSEGFGDYLIAFGTSVQMFLGRADFHGLPKDAHTMASVYTVIFNIFFLVLFQLMLSIIIKGYIEMKNKQLSKQHVEDKSPLTMFLRKAKNCIDEYSTMFSRCALPILQTFMPASSGGMRVNQDLVQRLHDQRKTKPKVRKVLYEKKDESDQDASVVAKDISLKPVKNFYQDGLYQFYVDHVTPNGPAEEAGVKRGWRLTQICQGDGDNEAFRVPKDFEDERKCNKDTVKMLRLHTDKYLPVTLVFESQVAPSRQCFGILSFIAIYVLFAVMVSRVADSYSTFSMHRDTIMGRQWLSRGPTDVKSFDSMTRMGDVMDWLDAAILDGEYACASGSTQEACSSQNEKIRPGWYLWHGQDAEPLAMSITGRDPASVEELNYVPKAATGLSLGYVPYTKPVGPQESMSPEERVRVGSNVGVMSNNYMRLTLQFPCFVDHPSKRWKTGTPFILDRNMQDGCAEKPCMKELIEDLGESESLQCNDQRGWAFNSEEQLKGPSSGVNYTYATEGTYRDLGGIAIGLGGTQAEAAKLAEVLRNDEVFKNGAVSAVFEFVTYNGNYDLFTYGTVRFSTRATGLLQKEFNTMVFPLNFFSMGSAPGARLETIVAVLCFVLYIICVIVFSSHVIMEMYHQMLITRARLRPPWRYVADFVSDPWNVADVVSVILNIAIIVNIFAFMLMDSRFEIRTGLQSWTKDYFVEPVNLESQDSIREFQRAAEMYQTFTGLLALNGLFLWVRFVKYFRVVSSLRLVMTTLGTACGELTHLLTIGFAVLFGFVFIFYTCFGLRFEKYNNMDLSFITMFMFLLGRFDMQELLQHSPTFVLFVFPMFQIFFIILMSQALAALVFRWRHTRRDAEEMSLGGLMDNLKTCMSLALSTQSQHLDGGDDNNRKLDTEFWQKLSILRYIHNLDETGRINLSRMEGRKGEGAEDGAEDGDDEVQPGDAEAAGLFNLENEEDRKRFHKTFKKAHMELASKLCRELKDKSKESGAGVGDLDEAPHATKSSKALALEDKAGSGANKDENDDPQVGIIEEKVSEDQERNIIKSLQARLDGESAQTPLTEEIWLDALLTVLEEAKYLKRLQELFEFPRMRKPGTPKEHGQYSIKKEAMERRLNIFLKLCEEEARSRHWVYLKDMAESKERVLKQQSLVLTDYLETLDSQIEKLQEEIKTYERKCAHKRSPLASII